MIAPARFGIIVPELVEQAIGDPVALGVPVRAGQAVGLRAKAERRDVAPRRRERRVEHARDAELDVRGRRRDPAPRALLVGVHAGERQRELDQPAVVVLQPGGRALDPRQLAEREVDLHAGALAAVGADRRRGRRVELVAADQPEQGPLRVGVREHGASRGPRGPRRAAPPAARPPSTSDPLDAAPRRRSRRRPRGRRRRAAR